MAEEYTIRKHVDLLAGEMPKGSLYGDLTRIIQAADKLVTAFESNDPDGILSDYKQYPEVSEAYIKFRTLYPEEKR